MDDAQAQELLSEGWRRYSGVIQTRRGEIQRNLDSFIASAYRVMAGHAGAVDDMSSSYRNIQTFARMLGELMAAVEAVHRARGTTIRATEPRREPMPPAPDLEDLPVPSVPLVRVRWLADERSQAAS